MHRLLKGVGGGHTVDLALSLLSTCFCERQVIRDCLLEEMSPKAVDVLRRRKALLEKQ